MRSKVISIITVVFAVLMSTGICQAKPKKETSSTDISFEDLLVKGKYHFSDEAVVTVEQDKVLDALLGIRKDFKDRMKRSAERQ